MYKYLIYFFCLMVISCTGNNPPTSAIKKSSAVEDAEYDSAKIELQNRLKPMKDNFERINAIKKWTSIKKKELYESTEGGEADYYYSGNKLEKIVAIYFGETGKTVAEYYLSDSQLSFVLESSEQYNRPIDWDTAKMKENNDNQTFDPNKSEVVEDRFYFENGVIIYNRNNQDCGAPDEREFVLEEQKRIITDYKKLIGLLR